MGRNGKDRKVKEPMCEEKRNVNKESKTKTPSKVRLSSPVLLTKNDQARSNIKLKLLAEFKQDQTEGTEQWDITKSNVNGRNRLWQKLYQETTRT